MKRARSPSPKPIVGNNLPISSLSDWVVLHDSVLALLPSADLVRRSLVNVDTGGSLLLKVAAFDLDDTLIVPRSGAVFPREDPTDWKWLLPAVPGHLQLLYDEGFMVVILSNQSGIGAKKWNENKADAIRRKIIAMSKTLNLPLVALVSTREDVWRKPNVGMWMLLQKHAAAAVGAKAVIASDEVPGSVFYCGDAAGRKITTVAGRRKDFSCSDRKFALNVGVPFFTPEQLYRCSLTDLLDEVQEAEKRGEGGKPHRVGKTVSRRLLALSAEPCEVDWGGVGPAELRGLLSSYDNLEIGRITADGTRNVLQLESPATFHQTSQEMVVFVGYPGCGKTTFFERFFRPAGYVHINRDTLKTREKCLVEAEKCWRTGRSLVIDNTNPSHADCKQFFDVVRRSDPHCRPLPVRVFLFQASRELSMHMSNVRGRLGLAPRIGRIAYNVFQSRFEGWSAAAVKSANIKEVLEIPPVACFDGLHDDTRREFFLLS